MRDLKKKEYIFIPCYVTVQKLYSPFQKSRFKTNIRDALKDIKFKKGVLAKKNISFIVSLWK